MGIYVLCVVLCVCVYVCVLCVWPSLVCISTCVKCKHALHLNRNNFQMVSTIPFPSGGISLALYSYMWHLYRSNNFISNSMFSSPLPSNPMTNFLRENVFIIYFYIILHNPYISLFVVMLYYCPATQCLSPLQLF